MVDLVQNITSTLKPLETESIDARLKKKRHDLDIANKNRRKKHNKDTDSNEDEFTTISVKAIILFLEDFLETRLNSKLEHNPPPLQSTILPWLKHNQSNDTRSKKAAHAYAHAAKSSRISVNKIHHSNAPELKEIYGLIKDLRRLQECEVKYLNVSSEEAFIKGIITAVNNMKSKTLR